VFKLKNCFGPSLLKASPFKQTTKFNNTSLLAWGTAIEVDKDEAYGIGSEKNCILTERSRDSPRFKWIFAGIAYTQIINMIKYNKNRSATSLFPVLI